MDYTDEYRGRIPHRDICLSCVPVTRLWLPLRHSCHPAMFSPLDKVFAINCVCACVCVYVYIYVCVYTYTSDKQHLMRDDDGMTSQKYTKPSNIAARPPMPHSHMLTFHLHARVILAQPNLDLCDSNLAGPQRQTSRQSNR